MSLEIKPIHSLFDFKCVHAIQRNTGGFRDEMIIPYTQLITVQHNGGAVLGAYVDGELVGFVYGYLGMSEKTLYLFSMRIGVLPRYQSGGIGTKLKLALREQMLRHDIDLIIWIYDPLLGQNAMVNIEKLGGFARIYVRNIYGSGIENPLQVGLALDGFLLEWHLTHDRVEERVSGNYQSPTVKELLEDKAYRLVNYANWNSDLPRPIAADLELDEEVLLVQVPSNLHAIRRRDLSIARGWRNTTRAIFETYFNRGYVVTGFASDKRVNTPNIYKIEKVSFPSSINYVSWTKGIDDLETVTEDGSSENRF